MKTWSKEYFEKVMSSAQEKLAALKDANLVCMQDT